MKLRIEKPKTFSFWKFFLTVILIAGLVIGVLLLLPQFSEKKPAADLAFEILNFEGDVQIYDLETQTWRVPKRGEEFLASQKIKTGVDGVINLQVPEELRLRLKENSLLENKKCGVFNQKEIYQLGLEYGVLFGATGKVFDRKEVAGNALLKVSTPKLTADIHGALFRIQGGGSVPGKEDAVGVLRGSVEIAKPSLWLRKGGIRIRGLEKADVMDGVLQPATKMTPDEWSVMKEVYELREKTAVTEAQQIDLSKQAGTLFHHVFDHGTFFTPKIGYAGREFYKDPDSGEVRLETEYDVFPTGSFVGIYIKTRDLDAAQYDGLSFDVRKLPEEGAPDSFSIELKSKGNVLRRFAPRGFVREWTPMKFEFSAQKSTPIAEVVFVFINSRVGEAKKGMLEFRNINLIPRKTPLPLPAKSQVKTSTSQPVQKPAPQKQIVPLVPRAKSVPKEIPLR